MYCSSILGCVCWLFLLHSYALMVYRGTCGNCEGQDGTTDYWIYRVTQLVMKEAKPLLLDLSGNSIGDESGEYNNWIYLVIGDESGEAIATALQSNTSLHNWLYL